MRARVQRPGQAVVLATVILCALALCALAGASAPARPAANSGPIDVLKVDTAWQSHGRSGGTYGDVPLEKGKRYKLVVSGTFTDSTVNDPHPVTNSYDAFYCYGGCTAVTRGDNFLVGVGSSKFDDADEFSRPGGPVYTPNEPAYRSDHTYTVEFYAPDNGVLKAGTSNQIYGCGSSCATFKDGGTLTISIYGDQPPAVGVKFFAGKVEVQRQGGGWQLVKDGMALHVGDRIHTGFKSTVTLALPGGSVLFVEPMSLLTVQKLEVGADGKLTAHVFLNLGHVDAEIQRLPGSRGDFQVRTPTTTTSVRGTKFSVLYDGASTIVSVTQHTVAVTPNDGGQTVLVPAGKEVASSATKVGPLSGIGQAGAPPGSVGPGKALAILTNGISKGIAACRADIYSTTLSPTAHGWNADLRLVGHPHGTANWTIVHSTLSAANALARRIAAGCASGGSLALSWTGTWQTSYGVMQLTQTGGSVSGTYCNVADGIKGTVTGTSLDGTWACPPSSAGRIHFDFSADGNSFTGTYSYGTAPPSAPWNGTRT